MTAACAIDFGTSNSAIALPLSKGVELGRLVASIAARLVRGNRFASVAQRLGLQAQREFG